MIHPGHFTLFDQVDDFHTAKATFVHNMRTAGNSMRKFIVDCDEPFFRGIIHYGTHRIRGTEENPWLCRDPGHIWTHVRNPWDVALSYYMYNMRGMFPTFRQFLLDNPAIDKNMEFEVAAWSVETADTVLKFEDLMTDMNFFFLDMGWEFKQNEFPWEAKCNDRISDYRLYYDDEMVDFIYEKNRIVVDKFNYEFDNGEEIEEHDGFPLV